jgi:hypothetical protein
MKKILQKYEALFVLLALLLFSFLLQFSFDGLVGVDGYYHIGMADQIRQEGIVGQDGHFPYLHFTTLRDTYANQHFLYHVLLIPFTLFGDLILGAKIAAAFFQAIAFFSFYVLLNVLRVRYAWAFSFLLPIISEGFLFRMTLPRAPAVSLAATLFLLAVFWKSFFDSEKKWWKVLLFIGSFFLVWLYGGFVLYAVLISGIVCTLLISAYVRKEKTYRQIIIPYVISMLGIAVGLVLHPYFPNILVYLEQQLFETGAFASVAVGGEWVPYSFSALLVNAYIPLLFFIASCILVLFYFFSYVHTKVSDKALTFYRVSAKQHMICIGMGICAVITFALQMSARRYVEYFVPFTFVFFAVLASTFFMHNFPFEKIRRAFHLRQKNMKSYMTIGIALVMFLWVGASGVLNIYAVVSDADTHVSKRRVSEMLQLTAFTQKNIPEGEIIFNVAWDDFPLLFMRDRKHFYAWGLDPTFLYVYSPELYEKGKKIWSNKDRGDVAEIFKNDFGVKYVFVNYADAELRQLMKADAVFEVIFDNEAGTVFFVK